MTLADHARRELELIGTTRDDLKLADSLIKAVEAFAAYGHSGGSHPWAVDTLTRLLRYEPLTPLTTDPGEWQQQGSFDGETLWQNRRDSRALSLDGGRTYWLVDEMTDDGVRPTRQALSPLDVAVLTAADGYSYRVVDDHVDLDEESAR
jgi:hypothetical protein